MYCNETGAGAVDQSLRARDKHRQRRCTSRRRERRNSGRQGRCQRRHGGSGGTSGPHAARGLGFVGRAPDSANGLGGGVLPLHKRIAL